MNRIQSQTYRLALRLLMDQVPHRIKHFPIIPGQICYKHSQSKYYTPKIPVQTFLDQNSIEYDDRSQTAFKLKFCPFCPKPHNNDRTNLHVLNVNRESGVFYCFRCKASGSYLDLRKAILGINVTSLEEKVSSESSNQRKLYGNPTSFSQESSQDPLQKISEVEYFIFKQNMQKSEFKEVLEYLESRGLNKETIEKYQIGCGYQSFNTPEEDIKTIKVLYFPMHRLLSENEQRKMLLRRTETQLSSTTSQLPRTEIAKLKIRGSGKQNKKYMRQMPPGPLRGFFGLNTVTKQDKAVVITEGEFDAMAVHQSTGIPAISLPHGANSIPESTLAYLEQFQKIILWLDNDDAGQVNVEKFAQRLGIMRTHVVKHSESGLKDANDFLLKKPAMIPELISKAKIIPEQNLLIFENLRDNVKERIVNGHKYDGVKLESFPFFNNKVKGFRMGELSILSGGTGSGKTTILSQISLQLSKKRIPTLWGSFEIRNQILITNMMTQFSQQSLMKHKSKFDFYADRFQELPLYFLSFFGGSDPNKVLGTISYAIQKHGISVVVIDTLQFLLSNQAEGYKKFDLQDYVVSELRRIATTYNVHIVVVVHPRKTDDTEDIGIHSIYGTSKATQEADNVWIIQNRNNFKVLDIKKNRYDGDVGRIGLGFNKPSKSFFELKREELKQIIENNATATELYAERQSKEETLEWALEEDATESQLDRKKYSPDFGKGYRSKKI